MASDGFPSSKIFGSGNPRMDKPSKGICSQVKDWTPGVCLNSCKFGSNCPHPKTHRCVEGSWKMLGLFESFFLFRRRGPSWHDSILTPTPTARRRSKSWCKAQLDRNSWKAKQQVLWNMVSQVTMVWSWLSTQIKGVLSDVWEHVFPRFKIAKCSWNLNAGATKAGQVLSLPLATAAVSIWPFNGQALLHFTTPLRATGTMSIFRTCFSWRIESLCIKSTAR